MISKDLLSFQGYCSVAQTTVESQTVRKLQSLGQPVLVFMENKYGALPTLGFEAGNLLKIPEMETN